MYRGNSFLFAWMVHGIAFLSLRAAASVCALSCLTIAAVLRCYKRGGCCAFQYYRHPLEGSSFSFYIRDCGPVVPFSELRGFCWLGGWYDPGGQGEILQVTTGGGFAGEALSWRDIAQVGACCLKVCASV